MENNPSNPNNRTSVDIPIEVKTILDFIANLKGKSKNEILGDIVNSNHVFSKIHHVGVTKEALSNYLTLKYSFPNEDIDYAQLCKQICIYFGELLLKLQTL